MFGSQRSDKEGGKTKTSDACIGGMSLEEKTIVKCIRHERDAYKAVPLLETRSEFYRDKLHTKILHRHLCRVVPQK